MDQNQNKFRNHSPAQLKARLRTTQKQINRVNALIKLHERLRAKDAELNQSQNRLIELIEILDSIS